MDKTLKQFKKELEFLIAQQTDPFFVNFFITNYGKEHFTDEDAVETRGYFKGLKVARECLEKHIALSEEIGEKDIEEFERAKAEVLKPFTDMLRAIMDALARFMDRKRGKKK